MDHLAPRVTTIFGFVPKNLRAMALRVDAYGASVFHILDPVDEVAIGQKLRRRRSIVTAPKDRRVFLSSQTHADQLAYWNEASQTWCYARSPPQNITIDFEPLFWRPAFEEQ